MRKTLSIVIPAYNEERHIKACLDAIAAQTELPDEVIVVDNNSTDDTVKMAESYPFVKVVHEKKQGIVFARNAGFDAAASEIIGRIDADTRLPENWVHGIRDFYADGKHNNEAYTGGAISYNIRWPRLGPWIQNQIVFRINRFLMGHYILYGSNMAIPTKMWRTIREDVCERTDIHEDLDLSIHAHRKGFQITYNARLRVQVQMRRVRTNHQELWENMLWWPRTLRVHHVKRWPLALLGAVLLYFGSWLLLLNERVAQLFGKPPLPE